MSGWLDLGVSETGSIGEDARLWLKMYATGPYHIPRLVAVTGRVVGQHPTFWLPHMGAGVYFEKEEDAVAFQLVFG